jgi:hypothetical protein
VELTKDDSKKRSASFYGGAVGRGVLQKV